jgi:hypothetical protein
MDNSEKLLHVLDRIAKVQERLLELAEANHKTKTDVASKMQEAIKRAAKKDFDVINP